MAYILHVNFASSYKPLALAPYTSGYWYTDAVSDVPCSALFGASACDTTTQLALNRTSDNTSYLLNGYGLQEYPRNIFGAKGGE